MDKTTCSICNQNKYREKTGKHPSGVNKYQDIEKKAWKGRKCPSCVKKEHTEYMRQSRGTILKQKTCEFCSKEFNQKRMHQRYCQKACRKAANPWKKLTPV